MGARASEVSAAEVAERGPKHETEPGGPRGPDRRPAGPTRVERRLARKLVDHLPRVPVAVVLWNGEEFASAAQPTEYRLELADRAALWRLAGDPLFQFGELYSQGRLTVQGDLIGLLVGIEHAFRDAPQRGLLNNKLSQILHRPHRNTLSGSRENVHSHYDIGNEFYRLWLDEQLVYTCAYFPEPGMTLEQAQIAKLDHVCRKLRLQPGQSVVEAGCGWGALALHMASRYGVTVRAYNLSREQIAYARDRARFEGLGDRVEFVQDDWRSIEGRYDAFVSIGMLEHVGPQNYEQLGDVIDRSLASHGWGLIHTIGRNRPQPLNPWIERRIFPGGCPPSLGQMQPTFEKHDFSIQDVENLRLHYAETARHWLERFDQREDQIRQMFDEQFVKTWRLYLAGSVAAFESGGMQLFQVVFTHGRNNDLPRSRADLYHDGPVATF